MLIRNYLVSFFNSYILDIIQIYKTNGTAQLFVLGGYAAVK